MAEKYSVAIDGPSGAGKSTLAKAAAAALGICYVDTGAIYRTIGYGVYRRGINPSDAGAVAAVLPDMQLEMRYDQAGLQRMMLAGEDVTDQIRLPEMSPPFRRCGTSCWNCSGSRPGVTASSWTAVTSARWCCRMPR